MNPRPAPKPPALSVDDLCAGILAGNRTLLARAITLIESNASQHRPIAQALVQALLPHSGNSIRVGITGVPGVGKSTFIEALGLMLCRQGLKVAVLAVDPSSSVSHGSILGDKTRMENLSRHPNCFIRPSPSDGVLGGVARKSRETILAFEAAGYNVVLVETVGVGQSETTVRSMVDFFLVLMLAGAGDELQGIKKGIIELADALVVTKADGANAQRAEATRAELSRVLHYLTPPDPAWKAIALSCSSIENRGIAEVWQLILSFRDSPQTTGLIPTRRRRQTLEWMRELVEREMWLSYHTNPRVRQVWQEIEPQVLAGSLAPAAGVERLLKAYFTKGETHHDNQD